MNRNGWRVEEWAKSYGISRAKAYELLKNGELTALKVGKITLITAEDDAAFKARLTPYKIEGGK